MHSGVIYNLFIYPGFMTFFLILCSIVVLWQEHRELKLGRDVAVVAAMTFLVRLKKIRKTCQNSGQL
jgi:hypothetical protein